MSGILPGVETCRYCFSALQAHLSNKPHDDFDSEESSALFVTWKRDETLRGCIGTLEPTALRTGLKDFAIRSAFRDPRFTPIKSHELKTLTCGVSLLGEFEVIEEWDDWGVGRHGLVMRIEGKSAVFLPEVAEEQGWSQEETIRALKRKAGVLRDAEFQLTRFQSHKSTLRYEDQ